MGLKLLRIILIVYAVLNLNKSVYAQCPGGGAPQQIVHNVTTSPDALIQDFVYPKFDPALGTLMGVNVDLTTSGFTMLQLVNGDGFANSFTDMEFRRRDRLTIPGMGLSVFNDVTKTFPDMPLGASTNPTPFPPYSINPDGSNEWWGDALIPDNVNYTTSIPAGAMANFIGSSGSVTLQYSIIAQFSALGVGSHYTMNVVTLATNITMNLTYLYCPQNVLAQGKLDFNVVPKQERNVLLTWTKENEENGILYTPEISENGTQFTALGNVQSQQPVSASTVVKYEFDYQQPATASGKLYFRVKQLHTNGEIYYSAIRTIEAYKENEALLSAYPNPADKMVILNFKKPQKQTLQAVILNSTGVMVESVKIALNGGQQYQLNFTRKHPPGVYFIRVVDNSNTDYQTLRILIK